jgi:hypothetical protein
MRAAGETFKAIRAMLAERGIERTVGGVQQMLAQRAYLGEVHFGKPPKDGRPPRIRPNLAAHEPLVTEELFRAAQTRISRGPRPRSDRLLANAKLLRCASCGGLMSVSRASATYDFYRCAPHGDCTDRSAIGADRVEAFVEQAFLAGVGDLVAWGSDRSDVVELAEAARKAEADLDAATQLALAAGVAGRASAVDQITALRYAAEEAQRALADARAAEDLPSLNLRLVDDWTNLSVDERRRLLAAGIERIEVRRGRAPVAERVSVHWLG